MRNLVLGGALLAAAAPSPAAGVAPGLDPRVQRLVEAVSEERLAATLKRLASFETRHTLSSSEAPGRGIGAAREWMAEELRAASPRLQVSYDTHQVLAQGPRIPRDVELRNVVAVLPGRSPRRFYVTAHYDTVARPADPSSAGGGFDWTATDGPAPGANDDGSGTALTMELARVFAASGLEFDATLAFVAFAGEEQGLVGATLHAQKAAAEGLAVDGVLNNDIVGNVEGGNGVREGGTVRVFSEGPEDSPSRQLARAVRRQAARYLPGHQVLLVARQDRFGRGGDHIAFNQQGYAAVRFTEARENYARQHTVADTFDGVSPAYLARNARANAATLASLALAPAAPGVQDGGRPMLGRGGTGYDAHLRWRPSAGAAGYRVFWRPAWTADWEEERTLGAVTEVTLPGLSIDDHVFGVAALDAAGNESLVSAYVNPPRAERTILTR